MQKNSVLFVVSSFGLISGAEHVLCDFLTDNNQINAHFLLIGNNKGSVNFFSKTVNKDNIYFFEYNDFKDNRWTRFFFMPFESAKIVKSMRNDENLSHWIMQNQFDCIYLNNSFENAMFFDYFKDFKRISHVHDMVNMLRPAFKYSMLKSLKKANSIITVSDACAKQLIDSGIQKEKITIAYNGISFPVLPYNSNRTEVLKIGFVGSTIRRKGFDFLISLVNELDKEDLSYLGIKGILLQVITNSKKDKYSEKCLESISKNITLCIENNLSRDEVIQRYKSLDMLIVPSRHDPLPTVVLEGISAGVCVLGSKTDGIPEMLIDESMMFKCDDIQEAKKCLYNWLGKSEEEKNNLIKKNQQHLVSTFKSEEKRILVNELIRGVKNA